MCIVCWDKAREQHGVKVSAFCIDAAKFIKANEFNFHSIISGVMIDDWNVEDKIITSLFNNTHSFEFTNVDWQIIGMLAFMTEAERCTALAMYEGFIDEQGKEI